MNQADIREPNKADKSKLDSVAQSPVLTFTSKTLDLTKAVSDSTISGYPYKVNLSLAGVTAAYVPEVFLKTPTDVISDICETGAGYISFYATKNTGTVTIDTIVCVRGGN